MTAPTLAIFTNAQRRVIHCLAQGHGYERTAAILGISINTARRHREQAMERLPADFYPEIKGHARLLMFYALATDKDQYQLVA